MGLFGVPAVRIVVDDRIDRLLGRLERHGREPREPGTGPAVAARARTEAGGELVGAALGALHPTLGQLVAHRVGEGLHGSGAADGVAVQVQQGVELVEAQPAIATQQREAGGAERSADQAGRLGLQRWWRRLVVAGRATTVAPLGAGPEAVTQVAELAEDGEAARRERFELGVEDAQLVQEGVASDLQIDAGPDGETGGVTHGELAAGPEVRGVGLFGLFGLFGRRHRASSSRGAVHRAASPADGSSCVQCRAVV